MGACFVLGAWLVPFSWIHEHFFWILTVMLLGSLLWNFFSQRVFVRYLGLADFIHAIHVSFHQVHLNSFFFWFLAGIRSLCLFWMTGWIGLEAHAMEWMQAIHVGFRSRISLWFEQKRRTSMGILMAASIASVLNTPFTAILVPIELSIGGSSFSIILAAMVAFSVAKFLRFFASQFLLENIFLFPFEPIVSFDIYSFSFREWILLGSLVVVGSLLSCGMIRWVQWNQRGFEALPVFLRSPVAIACLLGLLLLRDSGSREFLGCLQWLGFSLILSCFGSIGVFSPLVTLGSIFGNGWVHLWSVNDQLIACGGLIGVIVFWSCLLNLPLAGAVFAYEWTGNPLLLLPAFGMGWFARKIREKMKVHALWETQLEEKGIHFFEGKLMDLLKRITVKEAMMSDHQVILETDTMEDLRRNLGTFRYPFLPVVDAHGCYLGLLTVDILEDPFWHQMNAQTFKLLQMKDLLRKLSSTFPTVQVSDSLEKVLSYFHDLPCVCVLDAQKKVVGLLFIHGVRLAYERQSAREALSMLNN